MLKDPTHQKVFSIVKNKPRGRLLDAGAGKAQLASALKKCGFDVEACDIKGGIFNGIKIKKVNLNGSLPYRSSSFNYVVAVEVLEHLENPFHIIREFRRILKRGGEIYITTPNITNIFSRVKFLLTGTFFAFSENERRLGHTDPIPYWQISDILKLNRFKIKEIISNQHLRLCGKNDNKTKVKRMAANIVYHILRPAIKPKDKELLKGDSIFVIAEKK